MADETKHDITVGELGRNLRDFRADTQTNLNSVRTDTQIAISKLESAIHDVRTAIAQAPYVNSAIFEEVRKSQGERIGELEDTVSRVNQVAWGAVISILVSIVGGVIVAVLLAGLK